MVGVSLGPCCALWYKHLSPSGYSEGSVFKHSQVQGNPFLCSACGPQHYCKFSSRGHYPSSSPYSPCHDCRSCSSTFCPLLHEPEGLSGYSHFGLSETYGPSTVCAWKPEWDSLPPETQAKLNARQGVRYIGMEQLDVIDTETGNPVPADGKTTGEIVFRGNMVMKGYLKNPKANKETFAGGWFHSGDIAVKHPDNYIEIKDRSKDIIISGGENISSVEVENVVYQHPAVFEASVVARPDERWQESPCAFVTIKSGYEKQDQNKLAQDIMRFCREKLPGYWVPKSVVFGPLPKTATGKIQKHILRTKAKEMGPVPRSRL